MRIGINPQKLEKKIELTTLHRIVVVVFIPELKGFYENSFEVFKLCVDSIISSINNNAAITIVNNGSCEEVTSFINGYLSDGKIDSIVHHSKNIGKMDAMIGAARGVREKLITLTDSDILFKAGWQQSVENIFFNFKDVGSVSPIPVRVADFYGTSSVLKKILLRQLKFSRQAILENFEDYNKYTQSINWDLESDKSAKWPILEYKGVKAILGSGHQVMTIDRDILFETVPTNPSLILVGNNSEYNYIDIPIDKAGKLRLSTYHNFAFHMGNTPEEWMKKVISENSHYDFKTSQLYKLPKQKNLFDTVIKLKWYRLKSRLIKIIFKKIY